MADIPFVTPMECLATANLPEGNGWLYEVKLDGYRAQIVRNGNGVRILSRNGKDLTEQFPDVAREAKKLPKGCSIDGELVALTSEGIPSFQLLQNRGSIDSHVVFYAFDLLYYGNLSRLDRPLQGRRGLLTHALNPGPFLQLSEGFDVSLERMLKAVRSHKLEGVIAKRLDSTYQAGRRTGAWMKQRLSLGQEFVIGGYTPGNYGFDALILGVYRDGALYYTGRVRAGFVPASRKEVFAQIKHLGTTACPFVNLPQSSAGRWGQGITAAKMLECVWLKPAAVAQVEFLEWTSGEQLRHTKFIGMRDDKRAKAVVRET